MQNPITSQNTPKSENTSKQKQHTKQYAGTHASLASLACNNTLAHTLRSLRSLASLAPLAQTAPLRGACRPSGCNRRTGSNIARWARISSLVATPLASDSLAPLVPSLSRRVSFCGPAGPTKGNKDGGGPAGPHPHRRLKLNRSLRSLSLRSLISLRSLCSLRSLGPAARFSLAKARWTCSLRSHPARTPPGKKGGTGAEPAKTLRSGTGRAAARLIGPSAPLAAHGPLPPFSPCLLRAGTLIDRARWPGFAPLCVRHDAAHFARAAGGRHGLLLGSACMGSALRVLLAPYTGC